MENAKREKKCPTIACLLILALIYPIIYEVEPPVSYLVEPPVSSYLEGTANSFDRVASSLFSATAREENKRKHGTWSIKWLFFLPS